VRNSRKFELGPDRACKMRARLGLAGLYCGIGLFAGLSAYVV
jgi:hypothetical protein